MQITLIKVKFNLFFDLSYSILVSYFEGIIQMSGRKAVASKRAWCGLLIQLPFHDLSLTGKSLHNFTFERVSVFLNIFSQSSPVLLS